MYPEQLKSPTIKLIPIDQYNCWGTPGYMISRKHAITVLQQFDKPFWAAPMLPPQRNRITAESIIMRSKGYYTYPHIILEENSPSDINPNNQVHHDSMFKHMNPELYE